MRFPRTCVPALAAATVAGLATAAVDDVSPSSGAFGTEVTISGGGLGAKKPKATLVPAAGGKARAMKVLTFGDAQVVARVGAAPAGVYDVVVDPRDKGLETSAREDAFTVVLPSDAEFVPSAAAPREEVVLTADGLGTKKGKVAVGGVGAKVLSWDGATVRFRLGKRTKPGPQDVSVKTSAGTAVFPAALDVGGDGGGGFGGPLVGNPWSDANLGMSYKVNGAFDSIDTVDPVFSAEATGSTDTLVESLRSSFRQVAIRLDRAVRPPETTRTRRLLPPDANFTLRLADGTTYSTTTDPAGTDLAPGASFELLFTGDGIVGFGGSFSGTVVRISGTTGAETLSITEGFFWVGPK